MFHHAYFLPADERDGKADFRAERIFVFDGFGRVGEAERAARDAHRLMERGQSANGHRQGQQNLVAILPVAVEGDETARLCGENFAIHGDGRAVCPFGNAQMNRERRFRIGMNRDMHAAAGGIIAFHIDPHGRAGKAVAHRAGRIAHRAQAVVAGDHPLRLHEARPCAQQRTERVAVFKAEKPGVLAAQRETRRAGEHRLIGLLHRLNAASIRRECRVDGVVHQGFQLICAEFAARTGEQGFQRRGQLARADRRNAAAGMRAAQQGIGRHAAARRAVRLVEPRKARFRRGKVLARTGQHAAERADAQTFAQVCAGGAAQQVMGVAGFILVRQCVKQLLRGERAGNRRAIGERVEQRGVIRALADEHHQHGEDRLLPGDVVEQNARFHRVGGVHRVLGGQGAHAEGVVQILHIAQHEGQQLFVAAHGIGGAERAQHAPAGGEGFARRAE